MNRTPPWLQDAALQQLFAAVQEAGGEARVVGGAVRDFLCGGDAGGDIDLASTLPPEQMRDIAIAQGWKCIPTGIDHGTVTLVLPGRLVEVTTLRRDVATDGRHAIVAYTDRFEEDAARRDFTINALYMDAAGKITDFFGGQKDLADGTVRFIGDAATRIEEDGLRMLRFFRFLASHGKPPADTEALRAIGLLKERVSALSGERIAAEMRKLLAVGSPAFAVRLMQETGLARLIFSRDTVPSRLIRLQMLERQADYQASVWTRVVLLLDATLADVAWLTERWKLSRHEAAQLKLLVSLPRFAPDSPRYFHTRMLRLQGSPAYLDWLLVQATLQPGIDVTPYVALARDFVAPVFPVTASDLMERGMMQGKALGEVLARMERAWEESDYALSREALLASQ